MEGPQLQKSKGQLVKHTLAEGLRESILSGKIPPGTRIVEGFWARKYGVAQASVREAIHLLSEEGLVTKSAGRSARVVNLSKEDVIHIYELRGAIESLAARLAAAQHADVTNLENAFRKMQDATTSGNVREMIDGDLEFHMELCRISNNPYLVEFGRRLLLPIFSFARIRMITSGKATTTWSKDLDAHQNIITFIRTGEEEVVDLYTRRAMATFAVSAHQYWAITHDTEPRKKSKRAEQHRG
jgi:DNA-binding GntR family transcriptional regulator